jgi:hypothetical protein
MWPLVYVQVKDERIKLTNEVFSGVKIIKLYAWERSFEAKLQCVREQEMRLLRQYMLTNIGACWTTPFTETRVAVQSPTTVELISC